MSRSSEEPPKSGTDHSDLHFDPGVSLPGLQNIERSYSFAPKATPRGRSSNGKDDSGVFERSPKPDTAGVLAGNGVYPALLARNLACSGRRVVVAGIRGQTDESLAASVDGFQRFPLGAINRTAAYFMHHRARRIYLAGGVKRPIAWRHARPDRTALALIVRNLTAGDDALLRSVASAFEARGLVVGDPRPFLRDLLAGKGRLAGPPVDAATLTDIQIAWRAAKAHGSKDRGQAAVARRGEVAGLEGKAGTDALIDSVTGPGAALAKVVKPGQDYRFDMPAIGPATVERARRAAFRAIAVEAGGVLLLERERLLATCNRHNISLVGFEGRDILEPGGPQSSQVSLCGA
jgi:UDP-2,3-diacylglucosamine hydrolase